MVNPYKHTHIRIAGLVIQRLVRTFRERFLIVMKATKVFLWLHVTSPSLGGFS